ncbi:Neurogenic protein big brain [Portunus trituberculatus]|uniref:Neurogenic protein big brain n=1 Tax=Portunus trituberculatus TaxID=210409 RepID=A0A5B7D3M6_PORTR|nr:Neurogenic protein big brain [Portunus trituberculatus]
MVFYNYRVLQVYWVAPLVGGMTGGLIYEYIFNPHRVPRSRKDSMDGGK